MEQSSRRYAAAARQHQQIGQPEEAQATGFDEFEPCTLHHREVKKGAIWEGPGTGTPLWKGREEGSEGRARSDQAARLGRPGSARQALQQECAKNATAGQKQRRQMSLPRRSYRFRSTRNRRPANSGQISELLFEESLFTDRPRFWTDQCRRGLAHRACPNSATQSGGAMAKFLLDHIQEMA